MAHQGHKTDGNTNHIVCREIPNSKTIRSFIEKRIREWIRVHGFDETSAHYQVILNREGGGHHFSCQIEVQAVATSAAKGATEGVREERWTGSWDDSGLHQTLLKTLGHMMRGPVPVTV
jgi:hypothetical protein